MSLPPKLTTSSFDFGNLLGEGAYARVISCVLKSTGERYAIKIVDKRFILRYNKQKYVMNEKQCLRKLNHENVVKLWYTFHDEDYLCMNDARLCCV